MHASYHCMCNIDNPKWATRDSKHVTSKAKQKQNQGEQSRKKKLTVIPFLIMPLNQPLLIQMKRHLRRHRLLRPFLLERHRALEHISLHQIDRELLRRRRLRQYVASFRRALREQLRHPVELGFDRVEPFGDGDGVVEDGVGGVVRVGCLGGFELVEEQDVVD